MSRRPDSTAHPRSGALSQIDLFRGPAYPDHSRFPHNGVWNEVARVVNADLLDSTDPLLITGYTSLDRIVSLLSRCDERLSVDPSAYGSIRVLLGHEPTASLRNQERTGSRRLGREIADYWLSRGVSIYFCADLLRAVELLRSERVEVRKSGSQPIHAKIYKGDGAITLGSSNYSDSGLRDNCEANCRFEQEKEPQRFAEAVELAEAIWAAGADYKSDLIALLEQLLRSVTWQEALGRACAELLEGGWAQHYVAPQPYGDVSLWPSQAQGIGQAMWVLENVGSVLVADATGSGKTRMGVHLIRALQDRNWRTGRIRRDLPLMICPPNVAEDWQREGRECGQEIPTISHGLLSTATSLRQVEAIRSLRRAQILAVDEAHNFLNRVAARTRRLYANMADHVLLFSATPINRGVRDLRAIVDLLGADNFDDAVLKVIRRLTWRQRRGPDILPAHDREVVREALQRFVVRRTKSAFNRMIDEAPERYVNVLGEPCRYPAHHPREYSCSEPAKDRELALQIRELAGRLRGLTHLRRALQVTPYLRAEGCDGEKYLDMRLRSAKALAGYQVSACLRSSRAALLEHLLGTEAAARASGIVDRIKSKNTGNVIRKLREIRGQPPTSQLNVSLPPWLSAPVEHSRACDEELEIYEQIGELARELSTAREDAKAAHLSNLLESHDLVLAFDSRLITLSDIRGRLEQDHQGEVRLATGQKASHRVDQDFAIGSTRKGLIALCSDALAEGVNLQAASCLVLLDMPSVIRVAEQRIGRVDRMDSPHEEIEVYWPDDAPEFALRSDELLRERHRDVADLIGSNLELPPSLRAEPTAASHVVSWREMMSGVQELMAEDEEWDGLEDAFAGVRSLVEGDQALVPAPVYGSIRRSGARVVSSVSVVGSDCEWIFLAIAGSDEGAPLWVYFDEMSTKPETDLGTIATRLRERLMDQVQERELDKFATERLRCDFARLRAWEPQLLPRKKQRALNEMRHVLHHYRDAARAAGDADRAELIESILELASGAEPTGPSRTGDTATDLNLLAQWWLDLIRGVWYEHLRNPRRSSPALLRDIRAQLEHTPLPTDRLRTVDQVPLTIRPLEQRVVAAIVGIKEA